MYPDAHRQRIINWINATGGTSSAFDVTTKVLSGLLQDAFCNYIVYVYLCHIPTKMRNMELLNLNMISSLYVLGVVK